MLQLLQLFFAVLLILCLVHAATPHRDDQDDVNATESPPLKAFIHIGLRGTGTSIIQEHLTSIDAVLQQYEYRQFHDYYFDVIAAASGSQSNQMKGSLTKFIDDCRRGRKHIIYIAEMLESLSNSQMQRLKSMFEPFEVTISITYREVLNRHLQIFDTRSRSFQYELNPRADHHVLSFLSNSLGCGGPDQDISIINRYVSVFGREHVQLIDFDGATEAGLDLAYIFTCEVMKLHCQQIGNRSYGETAVQTNHFPIQVAQQIMKYGTNAYQCIRPVNILSDELISYVDKQLKQLNQSFPALSVRLKFLAAQATSIDSMVRSKYENIMLHSSKKAAQAALSKTEFWDIDTRKALSDAYWIEWMTSKVHEIETLGFLSSCQWQRL